MRDAIESRGISFAGEQTSNVVKNRSLSDSLTLFKRKFTTPRPTRKTVPPSV